MSAAPSRTTSPTMFPLRRRGFQVGILLICLECCLGPVRAQESEQSLLPADRGRFHLFLLAGQSNMAGRGKVQAEDLRPDRRVLTLNREGEWEPAVDPIHFDKRLAGVGPGRTFGIEYAKLHPDVTVGLIPCAVGGTALSSWEPGAKDAATKTHPYDDAMKRCQLALKSGTLKGILWHQGESDSRPERAEVYEVKLHQLIGRLRDELHAPNVPFIAGQLGQFPERPWNESRKRVDAAHQNLPRRIARTGFVKSDGLTHGGDQTHFDSRSSRELGRRFLTVFEDVAGRRAPEGTSLDLRTPEDDATGPEAEAGDSGETGESRSDAESDGGLSMKLDARIRQLVSSIKRTRYQHTTEIDEREGTVYCDCSGLVGYVLRHDFPEAYLALRGSEAPWRKRPLAVTYYQTFVAASGGHAAGPWRHVTRMLEARPGDVLAWRKRTVKQGETTGHTCLIVGIPELITPGLVRVQVIDSTRRPQAADRRTDGKDGVGWALKTFLIDDTGKPKGYLVGERPVKAGVAIGRMVSERSEGVSFPKGVDEAVADEDGREGQLYHGKTREEAVRIAESREVAWRIIRENGEPRPVGWKIREDRLNFVLVDGRVQKVIRG